MKRQFAITVRNETKRIVEVTGNSFPIDIIISDSSEQQTATFNVRTNRNIDDSKVIFEERSEEIYLTILDCNEGIKGIVKAFIPKENNFIVCYKEGTFYYQADKNLLTSRCWKNGKKVDIPPYQGSLRRIHIGENIKISFFDRENATFKL